MNAYRKYLLAAGVVLLGGTAVQAADLGNTGAPDTYAAMGFYLRADAGWSFLDWSGGKNANDPTFGGGVGYRFDDNLRADLRVDYSGKYNTGSGSSMGITTTTGNMYFDIPTSTAVTPYLGAGLGYSWANVSGGGNDKNGLTAALMAGVGVDLTNNLTLDVGYRFVEVLASGSNPMEHQILAGLRYEF